MSHGGTAARVSFGVARDPRKLKGDGEDDESESASEGSEPKGDADNDTDNDAADNAKKGYYDGDDAAVSAFGHAADRRERRRLLPVAERYYTAAASADGTAACTLIDPGLARALPADYGRPPGPPYLRGAKTCATVMALMFTQQRAQFTAAPQVTGVRVAGERAYVLLGSTTEPAGFIELRRRGASWTIAGLAVSPLP